MSEATNSPAVTEAYPIKPVRLIEPFGVGGGPDLLARVLARQKDGVGVSRQSNVRQLLVFIWSRKRQLPLNVIGRNSLGFVRHIY